MCCGQPYELTVRFYAAEDSSYQTYDKRVVKVSTRHSLIKMFPSADVRVNVKSTEVMESYEKSFLWWTYDSHEPRSLDKHVSAAKAEFQRQLSDKQERFEEAQR